MDNGIGLALVFATSTCLDGLTRGMNFLRKLGGVVGTIGKEKYTGMIGRIHRWMLPTGKERCCLFSDPCFHLFLGEHGGGGSRNPKRLEQPNAVLFLFLGEDLMEDVLVKDNCMSGWNRHSHWGNVLGNMLQGKSSSFLLHREPIPMGRWRTAEILRLLVQIDPSTEYMFVLFHLIFLLHLVRHDDHHGTNVAVPTLFRGGGTFGTNTNPIK